MPNKIDRPRVCAIVPAFNEEKTIASVVEVLVSSPLIDDVFVVSDGSSDRTEEIARATGATKVFALPKNFGKGHALQHGVAHTDAPIIVFFDADLIGLTEDHVEKLLLPVISGSRVMNVGVRDKGPLTRLTGKLPLIGGERALKRKIMEHIPDEYVQGFMIESALNYYCRSHGLRYGSVILPGLTMRRKFEKVGLVQSLKEYAKMNFEVIKAMILVRLAHLFKKF